MFNLINNFDTTFFNSHINYCYNNNKSYFDLISKTMNKLKKYEEIKYTTDLHKYFK